MSRALVLTCCVLLWACPDRAKPERGLRLVYRKPETGSLRAVVDRRLAQLKVKANLQEDDGTLTLRLPEGADVERVKALLAQRGVLDFCEEGRAEAERWCDRVWPSGVAVNRAQSTCALSGGREALALALADAGTAVAFGDGASTTAWALGSGCLAPRVVAAEVKEQPLSLSVDFDRSGGRDFGAMTQRCVGRRLLIRLDGVVQSAPLVMEAITGSRAMITTGAGDRAALEVLAASLVGGALPALVLEREDTWGPPSL